MAKKSRHRKPKYRAKPPERVRERYTEQAKPVTPRLQTSRVVSPKSQHAVADYSYVTGDLRLIGILAGTLIIVLIILSFILG
jgi:hypothetical protein